MRRLGERVGADQMNTRGRDCILAGQGVVLPNWVDAELRAANFVERPVRIRAAKVFGQALAFTFHHPPFLTSERGIMEWIVIAEPRGVKIPAAEVDGKHRNRFVAGAHRVMSTVAPDIQSKGVINIRGEPARVQDMKFDERVQPGFEVISFDHGIVHEVNVIAQKIVVRSAVEHAVFEEITDALGDCGGGLVGVPNRCRRMHAVHDRDCDFTRLGIHSYKADGQVEMVVRTVTDSETWNLHVLYPLRFLTLRAVLRGAKEILHTIVCKTEGTIFGFRESN